MSNVQYPTSNVPRLPVMAHLVLGYPTLAESIRTVEAYIRAGVEILELQIPFSHPTADGPVITAACQEAVERQHVSMADCLSAIRAIRERHPEQEIMVMSYVNRVFAFGFQAFAEEMDAAGVQHLIIPDLPVDSLIAEDLTTFKKLSNLKLVPVLAANVSDVRLEKLLGMGFNFFYLMSDFKITGSGFSLNPRLQEVITRIRRGPVPAALAAGMSLGHPAAKAAGTGARIGIGFGISTPKQARLVATSADVAIIGSALIQAQQEGRLEEYLETLKKVFKTATEPA